MESALVRDRRWGREPNCGTLGKQLKGVGFANGITQGEARMEPETSQ
jgi:hypothetical protein